MHTKTLEIARGYRPRQSAVGAAAMLGLMISVSPSWSQSKIEPDADAVLHAMSDDFKSLRSFRVDYDSDHEILDKQGQKLQYSASGTIELSRDAGFLITRKGPFVDMQVSFDGKLISIFGKGLNVYGQITSPGPSIEQAIGEFQMSTGLDMPGADLFSADPYATLTEGVVSGALVGTAYVGGVECDHLAFRNDTVDWQLWVSKGDKKLPMKYVITTKWVTAAPQYQLRLDDWNTDPIDAKVFTFTPPAGATRIEEVNADEIGELMLENGK